jgi:hypothetical protein
MPLRNDAVGWLAFLSEGVPELERQGIPVVFAEDFPYCVAQAEDWFVAVEESVGSDWFDLDLGVTVAGERISLVPPLLRLLREEPDLLAWCAASRQPDISRWRSTRGASCRCRPAASRPGCCPCWSSSTRTGRACRATMPWSWPGWSSCRRNG